MENQKYETSDETSYETCAMMEGMTIDDICRWLKERADIPESVLDSFKGTSDCEGENV